MFDELVHEYCVYRGFIEFSVVDSPGKFLVNFTFHSYISLLICTSELAFVTFSVTRDAT